MTRAALFAFAVLVTILGLPGCGGGGAEVAGSVGAGGVEPAAPTGLTATAMSSSQISLTWDAATNVAGATSDDAVAAYNVYRGAEQIAALGTVTAFMDTGLASSTEYTYSVEAVSRKGKKSPRSREARATTSPPPDTTAPSIPTGLTAAAASSTQINLSWTAATDNVGIAGYNVYRGGVLIAALGTVTTFQNTGLAVFTTYSYTVQAYDAAGNVSGQSIAASATTQTVPDTTAPSAPTGLSAAAVSSSQINLSWSAATDNVGVTGYNVYRAGTLIATLGTVTTFQNTALTASTTFSYTVRALDAAGNLSTPSASASATTQAVPDTTAPSVPTGLSATVASATQINLSWTAATDNVAVTGYNVRRDGVLVATLGAVTTFQNNSLAASTTYSYTVQALDAAGNVSGQSIAASATTQTVPDTTAPSAPTGLSAAAVSSSQINLSWSAATDNVGVTGYNVYRAGTLIATLGTVTTFQNTALTASTTFSYTVRALDAAGNLSTPSASASATTQPAATDTTAPSTPTGLSATVASATQINLSWTAATDNVAVTGYNVRRNGVLVATLGAVTTFQNNSLAASTTYTYTVQAFDAAGNVSGQSIAASATTQTVPDTTAPSAPTGLSAAAVSSSQINLSWSAATDNVGVTGYNVYRAGTLIATLGTVTTFQNTALTASTTFSYTVRALDAAGNLSTPSASASATTQAVPDTTAPSVPTGLSATVASATQINLSWTAATDNVAVTGYNVRRDGVLVATLGAVTTFQNNSLAASTTYSYTVQALDAAGNVSGQSIAASATTQTVPDTTAPSAPTGLSAAAVSSSQINLSWSAATDNVGVTGYNVYRAGTLIATLGTVTTFQNTALTASTTFSYTVRALDAAGNLSTPSASASATTQAAPDITAPSTPLGLSATAVSSSLINLSWTAATDNVAVTGYNVRRNGVLVATLGAVTTFQNNSLAASTTYTYTVQAFDAAGNISGQSIAANATTLVPVTTATLSWDPVTVTNLSGYRVYFGTAPGTYVQAKGQGIAVGNVTTHTVTGLTSGTRYFFAVTDFDTSNNESAYSNEVFKDLQ